MNAPLRRVGIVIFVLFALLFANLNWVQAYKADSYRTNKYNGRVQLTEYQQQRGAILDRNGVVLARSVATNDTLKYQREYPYGAMFEPILGYKPVVLGTTGIEGAEDSFLNGTATDRLSDLFFTSASAGDNVTLSMIKSVQQTAYDDLASNGAGGNVGAAVAIDPTTGAILALASTPSFDPTNLASHDKPTASKAYDTFNKQDPNPLINRATQERYPPGSTFKVIVAAAALNSGYTPDNVIPAGSSYTPVPGSSFTMTNAESETCPQSQITLIQALTVSCNTAFARLGVSLGSSTLTQEAQAFGFGDSTLALGSDGKSIPVAASVVGNMTTSSGNDDANLIAQSSIGQYQDQMTVMEGALMAATVANGGVQERPYLVQQVQDSDLKTTYVAQPSELRRPVTPGVAGELSTMMQSVVQSGTATAAQIPGYVVAGKTGTAQNLPGAPNHRWFIGYVTTKDGKPIVAVAVLLVNGGNNGKKSAPKIAGDIMKAAITAEGK